MQGSGIYTVWPYAIVNLCQQKKTKSFVFFVTALEMLGCLTVCSTATGNQLIHKHIYRKLLVVSSWLVPCRLVERTTYLEPAVLYSISCHHHLLAEPFCCAICKKDQTILLPYCSLGTVPRTLQTPSFGAFPHSSYTTTVFKIFSSPGHCSFQDCPGCGNNRSYAV